MKNKILASIFILTFLTACQASQDESNSVINGGNPDIYLADPTIFYHSGTYYLYGTSGRDANQGFFVYTSPDLKSWAGPMGVNNGYALRKEDVFGDHGFWAPQVFFYEDKFYMAYTANENIAIAQSDSPLGPFTQEQKKALEAPVKQIDPYVFVDDDGKKYLYHVRLTEGNRIFVAEMEDDFSAIKPGTLRQCISATEPWENTVNAPWPVAEGPSILKKDGRYYLVYSANDFRNADYAVGYAVSTDPLGPWEKYGGNPILTKDDINENGTGHGDFVKNEQGDLYYVFHTHNSDELVAPRKTAIIEAHFSADNNTDKSSLLMDGKSFFYPEIIE